MSDPPPTVKDGLIMNLVDMKEARVESHKLLLPAKIDGTEGDTQRAIIFHAAAGQLQAAKNHITAQGRIEALAAILAIQQTCKLQLSDLEDLYYEGIFKPSKYTVQSFHSSDGTRVQNSVTDADPQVLKTVGDMTTNRAANARRVA